MMDKPVSLPPAASDVWDELVAQGYRPGPGFDAYCGQVAIERDCAARVLGEGVVVADEKGRPVPHPAIEVQRKAQVEIRAWGREFAPRPVRSR